MNRTYSGESLQINKLATCFRALIGVINPEDIWLFYPLSSSVQFHGKDRVLKKLDQIESFEGCCLSLVFQTQEKKEIRVTFIPRYKFLVVIIEGVEITLVEELFSIVENVLVLKNPTENDLRSEAELPAINELLWKVYDDLQLLKAEVAKISNELSDRKKRHTRCFVSFRFDDHSKSLAFELREFFEKIDVELLSGLGFEPRSVSEKVLARLNQPLDLFLIIFTPSGDSAWLNQEVGVAKARNLPIFILVEEGAKWDKGLLGDIEYIEFPRECISKTFTRLIEGVGFLKSQKNTK